MCTLQAVNKFHFCRYVAIRNWGGREPTHGVQENCMGVHKSLDWKWFDLACASRISYICEMFT